MCTIAISTMECTVHDYQFIRPPKPRNYGWWADLLTKPLAEIEFDKLKEDHNVINQRHS